MKWQALQPRHSSSTAACLQPLSKCSFVIRGLNLARFRTLDEATVGVEELVTRTVDCLLAINEQNCAPPFSTVISESSEVGSELMERCNYVRGQIAVLHYSLLNNEEPAPDFAPREVAVGPAELPMFNPLLQELSTAAHQAGAIKMKWAKLEVSREALEPVLRIFNISSALFTSGAGAIGSHVLLAVTELATGSLLLAAVGGGLAVAGSFFLLGGAIARQIKWPYHAIDAPPATARAAVMEMPQIVNDLHSFLDLLRRDTEAWRALLRDNPEGMMAQELRDRLMTACDVYLHHFGEQRRRLQVHGNAANA